MTPKTLTYYDHSDFRSKLIELGAPDNHLLHYVIVNLVSPNNDCINYVFLRVEDFACILDDFKNNECDDVIKVLNAMNLLADELGEDHIHVSFSW